MDRILRQMRIFQEVAELKSFTKAAYRLGVPKAAVSTGVGKLETLIGTRLLHRTTRSVQLTPDGVFFLEKCKAILIDIEEVSSMFKHDEQKLKGRLKVDVPSRIARKIIIPNLPKFFKQYPDIRLELGSTDRKVDLIQEGIDCVVRVGELADSSLIVKPIGHLKLINCASPGYLKKYGKLEKLDDLAKHSLVNYYTNYHSEKNGEFEYLTGNKINTIKMESHISVNNAESYIAAAVNDLGIIQVPEFDVKDLIEGKKLVQVLPDFKQKPMQISFIYPHKKHLSQRVKAFMTWANKIMQRKI